MDFIYKDSIKGTGQFNFQKAAFSRQITRFSFRTRFLAGNRIKAVAGT